MAYRYYNPNPTGTNTEDCQIRAVTKALGVDWDTAYLALAMQGFIIKREQTSKETMWAYLQGKGFARYALPDTCPACYTVSMFAEDHPKGTFILGTSDHIVTVVDGDWWDSFDSGDRTPVFVWVREER